MAEQERVSAYVDNGHGNLVGQGSSVINSVNKHKDIYTKGSTDDASNNHGLAIIKGDAVYETSNNIDGHTHGLMIILHAYLAPWFRRGGGWYNGGSAGAFSFISTSGGVYSYYGFRPVLLVNAGL